MKFKKLVSIVLVMAMLLCSLCSCSNVSKVATFDGNKEVPTGVYIYYLVMAYENYANSVDNPYLPKNEWTIQGQSFNTFIENYAEAYLYKYMVTEHLFDKLGLTLDEARYSEDIAASEQAWNAYGQSLEMQFGVSKAAYTAATYNEFKLEQIQMSIYGKGGEKEISEEEIETFFTENFRRVKYVSDVVENDNQSELEKIYNDYVTRINKKNESLQEIIYEEAARQNGYTKDSAKESLGPDYGTYFVNKNNASYPAEFIEAIFSAEDNLAHTYVVDGQAVVIYQLFDLMGDKTEYNEAKESLIKVISEEEFGNYIKDAINEVDYKINDAVFEKYNGTKLFG